MAEYRVFSTIDLKSAYHQVPIKRSERQYTAFEANTSLYQFCRVPFGVTNRVAAFQRTMDAFISNESLNATFAYLDDITICGRDQAHHDRNLERFLAAAKRKNLTYNEEKCVLSTRILSILGCVVSEGENKTRSRTIKTTSTVTTTERYQESKTSDRSFLPLLKMDKRLFEESTTSESKQKIST